MRFEEPELVTVPTAGEAEAYLRALEQSGYTVTGAPGTDTWLAVNKVRGVTLIVKAETS